MDPEERRWLIMKLGDLRYSRLEFSFSVKVMSGKVRKKKSALQSRFFGGRELFRNGSDIVKLYKLFCAEFDPLSLTTSK